MGTGSRKTWLEKQPDEVQLFVLSMEDEGRTLKQQCQALKEKFGIAVHRRTLWYSLCRYHQTIGKELLAAEVWGREVAKLLKEYPNLDPEKLARGLVLSKFGSAEFRAAEIKPRDVLASIHREQGLKLQAQRIAAQEARNRLAREQVELERRRVELLEKKLPHAREKLQEVAHDEKASPEDVRRRIREIYGLLEHHPSIPSSDEEGNPAPGGRGGAAARSGTPAALPGKLGTR